MSLDNGECDSSDKKGFTWGPCSPYVRNILRKTWSCMFETLGATLVLMIEVCCPDLAAKKSEPQSWLVGKPLKFDYI